MANVHDDSVKNEHKDNLRVTLEDLLILKPTPYSSFYSLTKLVLKNTSTKLVLNNLAGIFLIPSETFPQLNAISC